ncbi:MAG: multicopper oxidase family protein [Geminicoccaceae bacterium]
MSGQDQLEHHGDARRRRLRCSRRRFLETGAASALIANAQPFPSFAQTSDEISLTAAPSMVSLVGESYPSTEVWAFNGQVPGPVVRKRRGERLEITVTNDLPEPTTVHWHGLRVPVGMDGVPYISQPPIAPGETFRYAFDLEDAGTFWYHPHINSSEQVGRGLYGALIVEEEDAPEVDRELLWLLDDWRLDPEARIAPFGVMHDASHAGRIGNSATINGRIREVENVQAGERIRLRLINAANARVFGLDFRDLDPWIIALDGQPTEPHRLDGTKLTLGPGMRADLILDMVGEPGSETLLVDGHYGAERAYELIRFAYSEQAPMRDAMPLPPKALSPNPIAEPDLDNAERHRFVFEGGAMGGMRGAMMGGRMMDLRDLAAKGRLWAINGKVPGDLYREPPLLRTALGSSHVIELVNRTAFEHPIHLHGHGFRILSRNGLPAEHRPFADTVLLGVDETIEIALVTDNPGKWMFHCHILEHQASGMMGIVQVG